MAIATSDIPQADVIWHVARVTEAIARGKTSAEEIGAYLGAKVPRQGNYYIQAARILGFVEDSARDGEIRLSPYGKAFARYSYPHQRQALRHRLTVCEPSRSVIAALIATESLDATGIARVIQRLAPLSDSTALRRAHTMIAWLRDLGMASLRDGRLHYNGPRLLPDPAGNVQSTSALR